MRGLANKSSSRTGRAPAIRQLALPYSYLKRGARLQRVFANRQFETTALIPGNGILRGRDKAPTPPLKSNEPKSGDQVHIRKPANCSWEISAPGRSTLHGGLSPGAPRGAKNGNFKNGFWTADAIEERRWLRSLVRSFANNETTE